MNVTPQNLRKIAQGRIFTIATVKRTNGEPRSFNARLGVKSYLKGGKLPYDPEKKNLLVVFDMQKRGYRMVNLDALTMLRLDGKKLTWDLKTNSFISCEGDSDEA